MPRFTPCTPHALVRLIGERCLGYGDTRVRVAVDGAPAADPLALAQAVASWLREAGRPAAVVDLADFQLPASQRLEYGRDDPQSFVERWFDYAALAREVLDPLAADRAGSAAWLPRLRDAGTDRSARVPRQDAAPGLVLLVAGPMLLGRWLDFDLTVQLRTDPTVLEQRTPAALRFTVPALAAYQEQLEEAPDVMVRYNHPDRPAVETSS